MHTMLGSNTPEEFVREYAGSEVADIVQEWKRIAENTEYETEYRANTDLEAYEADLEHLHRMMHDWVDELGEICEDVQAPRIQKKALQQRIEKLSNEIYSEL